MYLFGLFPYQETIRTQNWTWATSVAPLKLPLLLQILPPLSLKLPTQLYFFYQLTEMSDHSLTLDYSHQPQIFKKFLWSELPTELCLLCTGLKCLTKVWPWLAPTKLSYTGNSYYHSCHLQSAFAVRVLKFLTKVGDWTAPKEIRYPKISDNLSLFRALLPPFTNRLLS